MVPNHFDESDIRSQHFMSSGKSFCKSIFYKTNNLKRVFEIYKYIQMP